MSPLGGELSWDVELKKLVCPLRTSGMVSSFALITRETLFALDWAAPRRFAGGGLACEGHEIANA